MVEASIIDDRGEFGFSWIVDEWIQRCSHVLVADGRVWFVDPVDDPSIIDQACALGEPAGVLQLLDRHRRGGAQIADRLGVPLHVCPTSLEECPFEFAHLVWAPWWREVSLWWPQRSLLVVPEAIGTAEYFTVGRGRAGVHPLLRLRPPRRLAEYSPETLLVGHGAGLIDGNVTDAIERAIADSRRGIGAVFTTTVRSRHR